MAPASAPQPAAGQARGSVVALPQTVLDAPAAALQRALAQAGLARDDRPWVLTPAADAHLAKTLGGTRDLLLVVVESPELALAGWLAALPPGDALARLATWADDAGRLLGWLRGWPGRFVLVDAEEAAASPQALAAALAGRLGALHIDVPAAADGVADPLQRLVARAFLADEAATPAREAHAQLLAACLPLGARTAGLGAEAATRLRALDVAAREHARLRGELETTRRHDNEAAEANRLLVRQVCELQDELATQHRRAAGLQQQIDRGDVGSAAGLRIGGLRIKDARNAGTHRHLACVATELGFGKRVLPTVDVRLVEHVGRPGLLVFASGGSREALAAWAPDGEENGRRFMLFVPGDAGGAQRLATLGTGDWSTVLGLARALLRQGRGDRPALPGGWGTVAARLVRQLEDLPARLRYDRRACTPEADGARTVELEDALFGDAALGTLRLRWTPGGPLAWLAPPAGEPVPLAEWPATADGRLQDAFVLPAGAAGRRFWAAASERSRALATALLDALQSVEDDGVRGTALALRRQLRADLRLGRLQARVHTLLRRLRHRR